MKTSPAIWTPQLQDLLSVPLQECSRTCYVSDIWQDSIFKRKCSALFSQSTQWTATRVIFVLPLKHLDVKASQCFCLNPGFYCNDNRCDAHNLWWLGALQKLRRRQCEELGQIQPKPSKGPRDSSGQIDPGKTSNCACEKSIPLYDIAISI